jgi:hypothetical protein
MNHDISSTLRNIGRKNNREDRMGKLLHFLTSRKIKKLTKRVNQYFKNRQSNAVADNMLAKEIATYYQLAGLYDKHQFDKDFPHAKENALENYRMAASMSDMKAQCIVGERLMEEGRFWMSLKGSLYFCEQHERYADNYFKESVIYLKTAHDQDYTLASRLLGVAYVNGWGVESDVEKGGRLIVDSIEKEGAWTKASEIFAALGLNKSEFFSKFMSEKGKSGE